MELTVKQKVYGTILAVGMVAVTVDRLLILPRRAGAEPVPGASEAAAGDDDVVAEARELVATSRSTLDKLTLADRFDALAEQRGLDPAELRDAFSPPAAWVPEGPEAGVPALAGVEMPRLTAVMAAGDDGYAIVNDKTLFIGQELNGFRLVSVAQRSAVFESNGNRIVLMLPDKDNGSR